MASQTKTLLARYAATKRHHPEDTEAVLNLQQQVNASRAEDTIRAMVSSWPPLSASQRDRLALLLRGGDAA